MHGVAVEVVRGRAKSLRGNFSFRNKSGLAHNEAIGWEGLNEAWPLRGEIAGT